MLGSFYWAAILFGAILVFLSAPKGRRALREAIYFASDGLTVASTALIPTVGDGVRALVPWLGETP